MSSMGRKMNSTEREIYRLRAAIHNHDFLTIQEERDAEKRLAILTGGDRVRGTIVLSPHKSNRRTGGAPVINTPRVRGVIRLGSAG